MTMCWLRQRELRDHTDLVMLRGEDTYANLPNKTVGPWLVGPWLVVLVLYQDLPCMSDR